MTEEINSNKIQRRSDGSRKPKAETRLEIDPTIREQWSGVSEEDKNLIIMEYQRITVKKITSIHSWIQFFGIVVILSVILQVITLFF